ncbi:MAG: hypothetical protein ACRD24_14865 [Terriglobales bacterium]
MLRSLLVALAMAGTLAGCQQLPPSPQDLQAKKFEAVPDKAVIYLVRDVPDFSSIQSQIRIGDKLLLKTYPGTYYRWEVPAGAHTITGYGEDIGTITVQVEQGRIYFVQQRVTGLRVASSHFELVGEAQGRAAVMRAVLLTTP